MSQTAAQLIIVFMFWCSCVCIGIITLECWFRLAERWERYREYRREQKLIKKYRGDK